MNSSVREEFYSNYDVFLEMLWDENPICVFQKLMGAGKTSISFLNNNSSVVYVFEGLTNTVDVISYREKLSGGEVLLDGGTKVFQNFEYSGDSREYRGRCYLAWVNLCQTAQKNGFEVEVESTFDGGVLSLGAKLANGSYSNIDISGVQSGIGLEKFLQNMSKRVTLIQK